MQMVINIYFVFQIRRNIRKTKITISIYLFVIIKKKNIVPSTSFFSSYLKINNQSKTTTTK